MKFKLIFQIDSKRIIYKEFIYVYNLFLFSLNLIYNESLTNNR